MKLCHITLSVKNLETSLRFYQEITGLTLQRRFPAGPGMEIAFLADGETEVELICGGAPHEGAALGQGVSLGFVSPSLDDTIALLREKSYETDGVIERPNPHVSYFFTRDPDGYRVQFVQGGMDP